MSSKCSVIVPKWQPLIFQNNFMCFSIVLVVFSYGFLHIYTLNYILTFVDIFWIYFKSITGSTLQFFKAYKHEWAIIGDVHTYRHGFL